MIALGRVRDRAARQKRAAQKREALGLVLQNAEIDVQRHARRGAVVKGGKNMPDFFSAVNAEHTLAGRARIRLQIKAEAERLFEQLRQPRGKIGAFRHDAHSRGRKGIAVQQHAIGFCHGAAFRRNRQTAELCFHIGGK